MGWSVLVPVRSGGKSRLRAPGDWTNACALDTLAAIRQCPMVAQLHTLGHTFDDVDAIHDQGRGLNLELADAASRMNRPLAIILGDLPSLTSQDLQDVLTQAERYEQSMVIDHEGTGTTMVMTTSSMITPLFGLNSATAHQAAGFRALDAPIRARLDVDTYDDLVLAHALGLGIATTALFSTLEEQGVHK